jgi:ABC-type lipoprotein release transport system permease subunit
MQQRMSLLLGLLTAAGTTLVGMMALMNVRERKSEVGILRALGSSTTTILGLFLTKALLLGVLGAVLGILLGAVIAHGVEGAEAAPSGGWLASLPSSTWSTILLLTPLFAVLASWVPATLAARQDPASVLGMDS